MGTKFRRRVFGNLPGVSDPQGFSLVEVVLMMGILVVALLATISALVSSMTLVRVGEENTLAVNAARRLIEELQVWNDFEELFAAHNADPSDDPWVGCPGSFFTVDGLGPIAGNPSVGEIIFPSPAGQPTVLREDIVNDDLGMPRDLSGDGVVDGADHSGDYVLLPVTIRVQWQGPGGACSLSLHALLVER